MQTIVHEGMYSYIHPIFFQFETLYRELSNNDDEERRIVNQFIPEMKVFEDIFNEYGECERHLTYTSQEYDAEVINAECKKKNIIIGFSGGKDSTATALYFKKKGFNVYLFHVHGLNKFFPQELESAKAVAKALDLPLIVQNVKLQGKSLYPDHPLKNIIIANMALQWGIENDIGTRLGMGNYYTASVEDLEFATAGDDAIEMWQAYKSVIRKFIPSVRVETPLMNLSSTLELFEGERELLETAQSCVMTYRFKAKHRERIESTYGVKLLPNRCGCCWKCAVEYIYFADKGMLDYNEQYYMHCIEVLIHTVWKETGYFPHSIEYVWGVYLFYPIEQSKAWGLLRDAFIYARKIKIAR